MTEPTATAHCHHVLLAVELTIIYVRDQLIVSDTACYTLDNRESLWIDYEQD